MKEKNNHKAFRALIILGIIVASVSFCIYLFSSASFLVDEIVIKGTNRITKAEVIKRSGIRAGMSTVFFHEISAKNSLLKNPWIKEVTIVKEYPSTVVISIDEYEPFCIAALEEGNYLHEGDLPHARKILKAAALTYVAGSLASLLNLGRWLAVLRR